ncbi:ergosterol biosynthesis ERG4/ERG24 [Entophlyctis helioformis]|nr:ergosterol biosynthesis ERG4/ERG24 [Entophlyctis helioformis]
MGPHGSPLVILGLPVTVAALFLLVTPEGAPSPALLAGLASDPLATLAALVRSVTWFEMEALEAVSYWMLFHILCNLVLPGAWVRGTKLRTGDTLWYRINGFAAMVASAAALAAVTFTRISTDPRDALFTIGSLSVAAQLNLAPLLWIADHYLQLAVAAGLVASSLAVLLYAASFRSARVLLAEGGNSGYPLYDFWMGRELNPRILGGLVDLKYMCELRPGLIGWAVINAAFAAKQYEAFGAISNSMAIVLAGQTYYVIDALWNERAILTTMDITTDGFGFMLIFGDLVWVPFTYTLQARYLSMFPQDLSPLMLGGILALNLLGLWIFRSANGQKNAFRTNPASAAVQHLKYIETRSGSRLLVSGWWGAARKINYLGDWLMAVAWCLPCGFGSALPYFYAVYFAILLAHRAQRDEAICRAKYGKDWDEYRRRVPYVFVPYVY